MSTKKHSKIAYWQWINIFDYRPPYWPPIVEINVGPFITAYRKHVSDSGEIPDTETFIKWMVKVVVFGFGFMCILFPDEN